MMVQLDTVIARVTSRRSAIILRQHTVYMDEKAIKEYRETLESQVQAMSFLVQVMYL